MAYLTPPHHRCLCRKWCGDIPEEDDPYGVCKGLPKAPERPLVEIVLVDRRTGELI